MGRSARMVTEAILPSRLDWTVNICECASPWPGSPAAFSSGETGPKPSTQTKMPAPPPYCAERPSSRAIRIGFHKGLSFSGSSFNTMLASVLPLIINRRSSLSLESAMAGLSSNVVFCAKTTAGQGPASRRRAVNFGKGTAERIAKKSSTTRKHADPYLFAGGFCFDRRGGFRAESAHSRRRDHQGFGACLGDYGIPEYRHCRG